MSKNSVFDLIERVNFLWLKDAVNYANEKHGDWNWFNDIANLSYSLPFHRTLTGFDHTYFLLDFDPLILSHPELEKLKKDPIRYREVCIRALIDFTKEFLKENKDHSFFAKISGSGIHLLQRMNEKIDKRRFKSVVRYLCKPCSLTLKKDDNNHSCTHECDGWNTPVDWNEKEQIWKPNKTQWSKLFFHKPTQSIVRVSIDLGLFIAGRKMVRWTYSLNRKIPEMPNYSIPIDHWDADWILQHMTRTGFETFPPHNYVIPAFSFFNQLTPESQLKELEKESNYEKEDRDLRYSINVPDVEEPLTEDQQRKINDMIKLFTGEVEETPPCIRMHYENCVNFAGIFWPRMVLVRYLAWKGYNPDDVALFFRFHINDEEDNTPSNRNKLFRYVKEAYGSLQNPDPVPGCKRMTNSEHFGVIDNHEICMACNRISPLSSYKTQEERRKEKEEGSEWWEVQKLCDDVLQGGESTIVKKATRAGVTTSMIMRTKLINKKMIVVTPTNRIGEKTIPNALRLAKSNLGIDIVGAMFAANKKACLKLVYLNKELRTKKKKEPDWGGTHNKIVYENLHYNIKPSCEKCIFNENYFPLLRFNRDNPLSYPIPILHSEMYNWAEDLKENDIDGNCSYATITNHIDNIDVIFTTYSKLSALMENNTEDAQKLREALFDSFDVLLLDEISYLASQSPLVIQILQTSASNQDEIYDIFEELRKEKTRLSILPKAKTVGQAIEFVDKFVNIFSEIRNNPPTEHYSDLIVNTNNAIISTEDREELRRNFTAFHNLIENDAKENNIHLETIEDILHLLNSDRWVLVSTPTVFHPVDVKIIAEPDVSNMRNFVRSFDEKGKQVIATDATLPYIDVSTFFGFNFWETEFGDPRKTNDTQLVITDSRRLSVVDLFFKEDSEKIQEELFDFINKVCMKHGEDNVIIIVPNIWSNYRLREAMTSGRIPFCDITWYRSDRTVGVECEKRVMICITAPHPPRGSHDWLAMWYHSQGMIREEEKEILGRKLSIHNTKAAFYQTIGRAKDPDCNDRSVVYLWGTKLRTEEDMVGAIDLMTFDGVNTPLPHIAIPTREESRGDLVVEMGNIWKEHGILLEIEQIKLFGKVFRHGMFNTSETNMRLNEYTKEQIESEIVKILRDDPSLYEKLGVRVEPRISKNNKRYWMLKKEEKI